MRETVQRSHLEPLPLPPRSFSGLPTSNAMRRVANANTYLQALPLQQPLTPSRHRTNITKSFLQTLDTSRRTKRKRSRNRPRHFPPGPAKYHPRQNLRGHHFNFPAYTSHPPASNLLSSNLLKGSLRAGNNDSRAGMGGGYRGLCKRRVKLKESCRANVA